MTLHHVRQLAGDRTRSLTRGDHRVAQQNRKGLVPDMVACVQDGVAETAHAGLPDIMNSRHALHLAQHLYLLDAALHLQFGLQFVDRMKVLLDGALGTADDDQDVRDAGLHGLLHDILDDRLVHDRQHLLGHGLGDRQETRAETGGGNDGLADFRDHGGGG